MSNDKSTEFNFSKQNMKKPKKEKKIGFSKLVILPFLVSIIGTFIVIFLSGFLVNKYEFFNNLANLIYRRQDIEITRPLSSSPSTAPMLNFEEFNKSSIGVAEKVLPSVVGIEIEYSSRNIFGATDTASATGTGFIISDDGYILTNNHVVNPQAPQLLMTDLKVTKVTVVLYNKEKIEAEFKGGDELTDLAIIKINPKDLKEKIVALEMGDSDQVKVGEFVMAVGRPLNFDNSVTVGVVSGLDRDIKQNTSAFKAIQTDAAINSGNSGGPLVNFEGKVIGVTTIKATGASVDGLTFAIPMNQAKNIAEKLIDNKIVERPEIGIKGTDIEGTLQQLAPHGILVQEIVEGSAADKAGILPSDIITKINGKDIKNFTDINLLKDSIKSGETLDIELIRSGKEQKLKLIMP